MWRYTYTMRKRAKMGKIDLYIIKPEVLQKRSKYLFIYGSRGSGKTTTVANKIIYHAVNTPGASILVTRKRMPSLRVTALKIFRQELEKWAVPYHEKKTESYFEFPSGSRVYFISFYLSSGERNEQLKSSTWDWIWIEEATEFSLEDLKELNATLRGQAGWRQMILTFNPPPRRKHAIYEWWKIQHAKNLSRKIHFHYEDNPYLDKDYIEQLEGLKEYDEGLYRRYTLGEWGVDTEHRLIYTHIQEGRLEGEAEEYIAGVDFGFNNPSVFLLIGIKDRKIYVIDEIYKRGLTQEEFRKEIESLYFQHGLDKFNVPIYCDSAEPARIEDFNTAGFVAYPSEKSILDGINFVKQTPIFVDIEKCPHTWEELNDYAWQKDKDGNVLDKPVKFNDHACDALRYAVYTHLKGAHEPFVVV